MLFQILSLKDILNSVIFKFVVFNQNFICLLVSWQLDGRAQFNRNLRQAFSQKLDHQILFIEHDLTDLVIMPCYIVKLLIWKVQLTKLIKYSLSLGNKYSICNVMVRFRFAIFH